MKKLALFLSLMISSLGLLTAQASKNITISGFVIDAKSNERIIGATIYFTNSKTATTTNSYGFYSYSVAAGKQDIEYRYPGFVTQEISIDTKNDTTIDVQLSIQSKKIEDIKVIAKKKVPIQLSTQTSMNTIPIATIKSLPAIFGEVDVLKALQLLPGVSGGTEGSAGLYVRGGSTDQNLYLLDGVPLYNVNHLLGFFSTFNADAISNVDLYKGGFPARFGGRLSSVVDVRMKEGNSKQLHGEASVGIISSKLMLEGPLVKNKSSFMISARRTYIDALLSPIIKSQTAGAVTFGYYFYDLNAKANYKISRKDHIYLSGYFGLDKLTSGNKTDFSFGSTTGYSKTDFAMDWGNYTGVARWNHLFTNKIFGNLSASVSQYKFHTGIGIETKINDKLEKVDFDVLSRIQDVAIKYDVDYNKSANQTIKFGVGATRHKFEPTTSTLNAQFSNALIDSSIDSNINKNIIYANEFDIYAEDDIVITKKLKANIGLHLAGFQVNNKFYTGLQPRLSARYLVNEDYSIKASYSRMNQFINLLAFEGIGLPTDLWVPVTDRILPQYSNQVALGFAGSPQKNLELTIEGYYKNTKNNIDYKDGSSYLLNGSSYENIVEMGVGRSFGGEVMLQKKEGRLQGLVSYTLSWAQRKYPTINRGEWYNFKYDRRHDFKIGSVYKISENIEFSGIWVFNSGVWNTIATSVYNPLPGQANSLGQIVENFQSSQGFSYFPKRNNTRLPAYHRLDLGFKFSKKKKYYERIWSLGCYNVYGRQNAFFIFRDSDSAGNPAYRQFSLFGFPLPSAALSIKF
jgi:hypothetical protein